MRGDKEEAARILMDRGWPLERVAELLVGEAPKPLIPPFSAIPDPTSPTVTWPPPNMWGHKNADREKMQRRVDNYINPIRSNQQQQVDEDLTRKQVWWESK